MDKLTVASGKMTKMELAHDFAMKLVGNPTTPLKTMESIINASWQYADSMQAEVDKRVKAQEEVDAEQSKDWQPDWSKAPDWANYWSIDFGGDCGRWYSEEPKKDVVYYQGKVNSLEQDSPNFGYKGLWKESLRKRPE